MATPGRGAVRAPPQAALGRSLARPVRRRRPRRECSNWPARSRGIREAASGAPGCARDPWAGRAPWPEAPAWGEAPSCPPRTAVPTRPALTPAARGTSGPRRPPATFDLPAVPVSSGPSPALHPPGCLPGPAVVHLTREATLTACVRTGTSPGLHGRGLDLSPFSTFCAAQTHSAPRLLTSAQGHHQPEQLRCEQPFASSPG